MLIRFFFFVVVVFVVVFFFWGGVVTECQNYFTHFEPNQSVGGAKTGDL